MESKSNFVCTCVLEWEVGEVQKKEELVLFSLFNFERDRFLSHSLGRAVGIAWQPQGKTS